MAAQLFFMPYLPAFNGNGIVVPGAVVSFYEPGTMTPKQVFSDMNLSVPYGTSITANAAGRLPTVYLNESQRYRIVIEDGATGEELDDIDNYLPGTIYTEALRQDVAEAIESLEDMAEQVAEDADIAAAAAVTASQALVAIQAINTGLYADTTAGLAATTSGEYFAVSNTTDDQIDIYLDNAGTAVLQFSLPSNATVESLLDAIGEFVSDDIAAIVDDDGVPALVIDSRGRLLGVDGQQADGREGTMFEALVWKTNESANVNMVRWPDFEIASDGKLHLFAGERRGVVSALGGENGMRQAWREVEIDFDNQEMTPGSIEVLYTPSGWASETGRGAELVPFRLPDGTIELLTIQQDPDNVVYQTAGTSNDVYRRTSADDYASSTKIFDGTDVYTTLGLTSIMPGSQRGFFSVPNGGVILPPDHPNAGRRILYAPLNTNGSAYRALPIYCEAGSTIWQLGEPFLLAGEPDFPTNLPTSYNEISATYRDGAVHLYVRNDNDSGIAPYPLSKRGRTYTSSANGIDGWTTPRYLSLPNIGNVQGAVCSLPTGETILFGSTSANAGVRKEGSYFIGNSPTDFYARVDTAFGRSSTVGYSSMKPYFKDGKWWIIHAYEVGDGELGFNGYSHLYVRVFDLDWLTRQMTPIGA